MRKMFSEVQKRLIAAQQDWKCPGLLCHNERNLGGQWELDHIIPLFAQGSNDVSNLRILCPNCHRLKTQQERMQYFLDKRVEPVETFNWALDLDNLPSPISNSRKRHREPSMGYDCYHQKWFVTEWNEDQKKRTYFTSRKYGNGAKVAAEAFYQSKLNP